jgi:hypothetical protein
MTVVAVAALAVVLVACGGDDEPNRLPSAGGSPSGGSSSSGGGEGNTTEVRAGLADLTSYKCTIRIAGSGGPLSDLSALITPASGTPAAGEEAAFEASVTYVKPDKSQMTLKLGDETLVQTTIGQQQWSAIGGFTVGPNAVGAQTATDLSLCASFWDEGFASAGNSFQCSGDRESVNGQQTRKCNIDASTFSQIRQLLGGVLNDPENGISDVTRFQMELWVTVGSARVPSGLPMRFRADMAGRDTANRDFFLKIDLDITNVNDSGLKVEAPR